MGMATMRTLKQGLVAMIIAMALVLPASAQSWPGSKVSLPDPVAFVNAMEVGDIKRAEAWLDAGLPPDFLGSRIGSGLMIGAWEGNLELMRLFISRGADINLANANGETAIALAAWRGQSKAVQWLLERGARINAPDRQWSALHYAAFSGNKDLAEYLIGQGADVNARTTNGSSVLMAAAYEGKEELVRLLIEKGADRTVKNDWGDGVLEWAMRYNHLGVARMVTNPEEFNIAISQPKERWGERSRSLSMSPELQNLLNMRNVLVERGASTNVIDRRIAAERARIVRSEVDRGRPMRAQTLEITASRKAPEEQSARIVTDEKDGKSFKVPPATFYGTPKMPPKGNVKNY